MPDLLFLPYIHYDYLITF